jgi:hypothetical protein
MKEGNNMSVENIIDSFESERKRTPSNVNELLDFVQKNYLYGKLSIVEYKKLFFELDKQQAQKPSFS